MHTSNNNNSNNHIFIAPYVRELQRLLMCRTCNREVTGLNLGQSYFAPRSTQPSIPPESVNEYQLWLGRQRQVWLTPLADEMQGVQVKL